MSGSRRTFSTEFKQEAVQLVTKQGLSAAEAAGRLGIGTTLFADQSPRHIDCIATTWGIAAI